MSNQPQDTGTVPSIKPAVCQIPVLNGKKKLYEIVTGDDMEVIVAQLEALMQQRELAARIDEKKHAYALAGSLETPQMVRDELMDEIAELKRQQTEAMKGEK